ncbi:hypothetical protein [Rhizorhabdus argentea]|uniref:hypothetical protein n=1 Tax=Rhizorhabdus argentea TaxID=1387174 RepID=UPI0030EE38C4
MVEIVIDELKQLVRATHLEDVLLTVDDVKRYNADAARLVHIAAERFGKIRLLVDARKLSIQPPEVTQHFEQPDRLLRTPEDRYALVLGSNLAKIQARRVLGNDDRVCSFLSMQAAEAWLLDGRNEVEDIGEQ